MTENERRRPLRRPDRLDAPRARQKKEPDQRPNNQPDQTGRKRARPPRRSDRGEPPQPAPAAPQAPTFTPATIAEVERFAAIQPYPLDPFQIEAARHLAEGRSVLVAAPTGTGKTIVAEMGIWRAHNAGQRAIYTAPLKALSNQKFRDLGAIYGSDQVGLLTGDIVTNPRAPIVVMTTEIYRNMLLEGSRAARAAPPSAEADALLAGIRARAEAADGAQAEETPPSDELVAADDVAELARRSALDEELSTVGCVIFDELHYLSDPGRGPVWEEAIIHSPAHVRFIGLSATVSNADELRCWIEHVHGPIALVFHTERAVPLDHYYYLDDALRLARDASGRRIERFPDVGGEAKLARLRNRMRRYESYYDDEEDEELEPPARVRVYTSGEQSPGRPPLRQGPDQPEASPEAPKEPKERKAPEAGEILTALREAALLPCLYFLPGRKAVETAAESAKGHLLVTPEERVRLQQEVKGWVEALPVEDQKLEQVQRLAALLPRGLAFHHAGLLPGLKVMVERLFQRGVLKAVFATDTLALGINMPARSVVLGSLSKFDGERMRLMTPNEYQQITGRAGRRGLDAKGAAVIPYSPWEPFEPSFAALTAPLLPVTSAFAIRYNSVLNLWRPGDIARLRRAVANSLREFQRRGGPLRRRTEVAEIEVDVEEPRGRKRKRRQEHEQLLSRAAAAELDGTIATLRALRYIGEDDELTVKGRLLRALFHPAGMVLVELMVSGALDGLTPPELAEAASWFTFDDDRALRNFNYLSQRLLQLRREIQQARLRVVTIEDEEGLPYSPGIIEAFHGVAINWHRGFSLGGLLRRIELAEGDLLVILNQTIDLLQQLQGAVGQTLDASDVWAHADAETRYGRFLMQTRLKLERLRPVLDLAWRGMLRGSVAQSRAIPSMSAAPAPSADLPPVPMAEDEEPDEARSDRVHPGAADTEEQGETSGAPTPSV